jgi:hypothetical protein
LSVGGWLADWMVGKGGGPGRRTLYLNGRFVVAHLHEAAKEDGYVFDVAWRKDFGVLGSFVSSSGRWFDLSRSRWTREIQERPMKRWDKAQA